MGRHIDHIDENYEPDSLVAVALGTITTPDGRHHRQHDREWPTARDTWASGKPPVIVLAVIWLVFELAVFRDASIARPWLSTLTMLAIGAVYLVLLLMRLGGPRGLAMPAMQSNDAELDADAHAHAADLQHLNPGLTHSEPQERV